MAMDNRLKEKAMTKFRSASAGGDNDEKKMKASRPAPGQFPQQGVPSRPMTLPQGPTLSAMPRPTPGMMMDPGFNPMNRMPGGMQIQPFPMQMNPNGTFLKNGMDPMKTPSLSLEELAKKLRIMFGGRSAGQ